MRIQVWIFLAVLALLLCLTIASANAYVFSDMPVINNDVGPPVMAAGTQNDNLEVMICNLVQQNTSPSVRSYILIMVSSNPAGFEKPRPTIIKTDRPSTTLLWRSRNPLAYPLLA